MKSRDNIYASFTPSHYLQNEKDAREQLSEKELDYFNVYMFQASGPRSFCTIGFEYHMLPIFQSILSSDTAVTQKKWLLSGSTGALRSIAIISTLITGNDHVKLLEDHYISMTYKYGDTSEQLEQIMYELYETVAPPSIVKEILHHPLFELGIMVTSMSETFCTLSDHWLKFYFVVYGLGSVLFPSVLNKMMSKILFVTAECPFIKEDSNITVLKLTVDNFYDVLHATCGIPFVQTRCTKIGKELQGLFYDAGLSAYSFNVPIEDSSYQALLFNDGIKTQLIHSWFDMYNPWKTISDEYFTNCSVLSMTSEFLELLPDKRFPQSSDWFVREYIEHPEKRQHNWTTTAFLSKQMFQTLSMKSLFPK